MIKTMEVHTNEKTVFADTTGENGKRASNIVLVTGEAGKGGPIVVIETLNTNVFLKGLIIYHC